MFSTSFLRLLHKVGLRPIYIYVLIQIYLRANIRTWLTESEVMKLQRSREDDKKAQGKKKHFTFYCLVTFTILQPKYMICSHHVFCVHHQHTLLVIDIMYNRF